MRKAERFVIINEQSQNHIKFNNYHRQSVINKVVASILKGRPTEEGAIGMFFWKLADLDPPVNREELMLFRSLFLIYNDSLNVKVESKEKAMSILGIPEEKITLSKEELVREAKVAYWKHFNEMSRDLKELYDNAPEIAIKKSAFDFICS